jgi:hypothetical protein
MTIRERVMEVLALRVSEAREIVEGVYTLDLKPRQMLEALGEDVKWSYVIDVYSELRADGLLISHSVNHITYRLVGDIPKPVKHKNGRAVAPINDRLTPDELQVLCHYLGDSAYGIIQTHRSWCELNLLKPYL